MRSSHVTRQYIGGWSNGNGLSSFRFIFTLLLLSVCSKVPSPGDSKVPKTLRFSVLFIVAYKGTKSDVINFLYTYLFIILRLSQLVFVALNRLVGLDRANALVFPICQNDGKMFISVRRLVAEVQFTRLIN
jgi:hypothetical protein